MTSTTTLIDLLALMAEKTNSAICKGLEYEGDRLLEITYRPYRDDAVAVDSAALKAKSASNHQALHKKAFTDDIIRDTRTLHAALSLHFPSLANNLLGVVLDIRKPSKRGAARVKLSLCGQGLNADPVTLPTLSRRFDTLERHLRGVSPSGNRCFKINAYTVYAGDPYDALRIFAALSWPDLIDNPPDYSPLIEVAEILNEKPLLQALFTGA